MRLRRVVFWLHLAVGLLAGALVLLMSVTGILMAFERQILERADGFHINPSGETFGLENHLRAIATNKSVPTGVAFERDTTKPVAWQFGKERVEFADPHDGTLLGRGNVAVRNFFQGALTLHRFLGQEGESRPVGKAIIGIGNLLFLFMILSGLYIWIPKTWSATALKAATLFQPRFKGRARDWNWHNVFGIWAAVPLLVIVTCGTVISQSWANALVFCIAGEKPPAGGEKKKPQASMPIPADVAGLDAAFAAVKAGNPDWQSIQLQLPFAKSATFAIADSHRGRPDLRRQMTVDLATTNIVKTEDWDDLTPGRRARTWIRWIHTGEAGGFAGQSLAGLAAIASAMLVWTGFALTWRRFFGKKRTTV